MKRLSLKTIAALEAEIQNLGETIRIVCLHSPWVCDHCQQILTRKQGNPTVVERYDDAGKMLDFWDWVCPPCRDAFRVKYPLCDEHHAPKAVCPCPKSLPREATVINMEGETCEQR